MVTAWGVAWLGSNILSYIYRFDFTDEYIIGTKKYKILYTSRYVPRLFHRLTEEFILHFSVL
jgi:hypothetical protein